MKCAHKFAVGSRLKTYFLKFFAPPLKNLVGQKPQIFEDCCQLEAYNFKMAHHIEKQITDVSSTLNVL